MANKDLPINNTNFTHSKVLYVIYIIFREFVYNIYLLSTRVGLPQRSFSFCFQDISCGRHSNTRPGADYGVCIELSK